ncbi:pyridoxamine 5'-phosphate oxidase family protein [Celeribacter indicus]|uniref:General stress protein FMN-binding split barrel domain-containing protein n=1 Tax=Celeribacter indicus TaxID=1208324 RepID=A0A0B5DWN4_9RHOB|nr:pyridoxamine 5'-phosphate oxidase family protein [Celeribacter indicus]AJE45545.1 hypothetical protein P73_0830 [Celeribacter indicus]SDW86362.1 General stress protein 26 [Celeribacter indicus]
MNAHKAVEKDPREALIKEMKDLRAGMLGVEGTHQHMQPMTHYPDWDRNEIWFLTSKDTDLVRSLSPGAKAHFCVMSADQDFDACLRGTLTETRDPGKLEEIWSPVAAAWFHGGKEDPDLTMLRLALEDAALWGSSASALKFGFEIAKANLNEDEKPNIGTHRVITF